MWRVARNKQGQIVQWMWHTTSLFMRYIVAILHTDCPTLRRSEPSLSLVHPSSKCRHPSVPPSLSGKPMIQLAHLQLADECTPNRYTHLSSLPGQFTSMRSLLPWPPNRCHKFEVSRKGPIPNLQCKLWHSRNTQTVNHRNPRSISFSYSPDL